MGIFADDVAEGFFKQGPLGLPRSKRQVGKLFADVFLAADVNLLEYLTRFTLPGVTSVNVLCVSEPIPLFFRR